jgi:hypothetical protein
VLRGVLGYLLSSFVFGEVRTHIAVTLGVLARHLEIDRPVSIAIDHLDETCRGAAGDEDVFVQSPYHGVFSFSRAQSVGLGETLADHCRKVKPTTIDLTLRQMTLCRSEKWRALEV